MSYLTVIEAGEFSELFGGPSTIDEKLVLMSWTMLRMAVKNSGCRLPAEPDEDLKYAQFLFLLEILQKQGKILTTTGEVTMQKQGQVTTVMDVQMARFNVQASDHSIAGENLVSMFPHLTYWQQANWVVFKWCEGDIGLDETIHVSIDRTTRGAGWNVPETIPVRPPY